MQGLNPRSGLGDAAYERGFGQNKPKGRLFDPSLAQLKDYAKFGGDNVTPRPKWAEATDVA